MIDAETPAPESPPAPPRRRRLRGILLIVLAVAVLVFAGAAAYAVWALGGSSTGAPVRVSIRAGASGAEIAAVLEEKQVIRSALVFRIVSRLRGVDSDLKPGVYELRMGLGISGVLRLLRKGIEPKFVRVTFPEGATLVEMAAIVDRSTEISAKAFLKAVRSGRHRTGILPKGVSNLEGLLFPKTYDVGEKTTADRLVERMLAQFEKEVEPLRLDKAARARGLSAHEAVILASLIEKEARRADEQALVSSVIHNRLDRGMRLQIDATIQYVYIQRDGRPKNPLETSDYSLASPYNTYRIDGLPPTPIAAPGLGALRAAVHPKRTDYFFYRLCDPDKLARGHVFGRTLAERDREWQRRCA